MLEKKKKKTVTKRGRILYFDEYDDTYVYDNFTIDITDEEDENKDENKNNDIQNKAKVKKSQIINIQEIKRNVVSEVHKNFRQWSSDLEFHKAYIECQKTFDTILPNLSHPI